MKFCWFNLMPWPDLPDDFRQSNRSVWVDIPSDLYDPIRVGGSTGAERLHHTVDMVAVDGVDAEQQHRR